MGIVLKRRDNAPIVKDVYGGIIDILMKDKDIEKAIKFLKFPKAIFVVVLPELIIFCRLILQKSY